MKKLLCIILCICINLSCISAFPTEETKENKCGENVIWEVKDGILTISGAGKMYDYSRRKSYPDDPFHPGKGPWQSKDFTKVVIKDGVTSIGNSAFAQCRSVSEIALPESLEEIGLASFYFCENLKKINIPQNVRKLRYNKEHGVEYSVFTGSCFEEINVSKDNQHFSSVDGVLYNKDQTKLIKYPTEKKDESFIMPENVESIEENRLINDYLKAITFSRNFNNFSAENFPVCAEINVPENNLNYSSKDGVLYDKEMKKLLFYRKNSAVFQIPYGVETLGDLAFDGCEKLTQISFPDTVKMIGEDAFNNCKSLLNVHFSDATHYIGDGAFRNCIGLTEINLPDNLMYLGTSAFSGCENLKGIIIPEEVYYIKPYTFRGCSSLEYVKLPHYLRRIEQYAFDECVKLTDLVVPDMLGETSENTIQSWAYKFCENLNKISVISLSPYGIEDLGNVTYIRSRSSYEEEELEGMLTVYEEYSKEVYEFGKLNYLDELPIRDAISAENPEVCVYNNKIYYVDATGKNIYRCDMDGTNKILITDSAAQGKKFIMSNFVVFAATSESGGGIYMVHPDTQYWARIIKDKEVSLEYCRDNYIYYNVYGNYYKMSCCVDISAPITYEELIGIMKN